jgi:hypothetical protein
MADLHDEVDGLRVAVVVDAVELIGRAVNGASCSDGYRWRIGDELQRALAQEHHLGVWMAVRRMWRFTGIELRLMDFDMRNAGDQAVENLVSRDPWVAGVARLGGDRLTGGQRNTIGRGCSLRCRLRCLGVGAQRMQKGQQGQALAEVATRECIHADDGNREARAQGSGSRVQKALEGTGHFLASASVCLVF